MKTWDQVMQRFYRHYNGNITFRVMMGALGPTFEPLDDKSKSFLNEFPLFVADVLETLSTRRDPSVNWNRVIAVQIVDIDDSEVDILFAELT